jgi:dUTP pyrophosphatase
MIQLKILDPRLGQEFPLPSYATIGSAGIDLRAMMPTNIQIYPDETVLISTGLAIHLEDPNLAALLLPRSGLGHNKGLILGNSVGLIDSDYQGPIKISCWNRSDNRQQINIGDRIAQLVVIPVMHVDLKIVDDFNSTSTRSDNGFGHTGLQ